MSMLFQEINLEWDSNTLLEIMFGQPRSAWKREEGISNRYLRYQHPYIEQIKNQIINLGYNPKSHFFAEMLPGTQLPVHTDFSRSNAINFPITGIWEKSPLEFFTDDRQSVIETYHYKPGTAVWINTQVPHSVKNSGNKSRFILSVSIYE